MKTTMEIRDDVLRRAKARAALLGQPLSRFIEASLERALREGEPDTRSWATWAAELPAISPEAIAELNAQFCAPGFRVVDREMWE
jgi:hypothetical protein